MKIKTLLTLLATAALSLNAAFAAEDDTPLAKQMKTVNKSLRTLKRQVEDASKKDENVALIAAARKSIDAALKLEPEKTKDVPAGDYTVQVWQEKLGTDTQKVSVKAGQPATVSFTLKPKS